MLTNEQVLHFIKVTDVITDLSTDHQITKKIVGELVDELRTLQQQNKTLIEALTIVKNTLAHKVHDDRTSWSLHKTAVDAIKSTQGGESNDH